MTTTAEKHTPTPWRSDMEQCGDEDVGYTHVEPTGEFFFDNGDGTVAYASLAREPDNSHVRHCVNAFHSPTRTIPTEQITEGLVLDLIDALKRSDDKLQMFIGEHDDPGADAFAVVHCNNDLLSSLKIEEDDA